MTVTLMKSDLSKQGGLEKYTWKIAQDFCAKGAPVTLLTSGNPTPLFSSPLLKIVSLPVKKTLSYLNVVSFDEACHRYLLKHPTPIIFSLDRNRFQTHLRAGNGVHAAYLHHRSQTEGLTKRVSFSINPLHQTILSLEKKAFEHPDLQCLFTNSHMVKEQVLAHYRTDPSKIHVVHNGVEWHELAPAFQKWPQARAERKEIDRSALQLLFIGHNFRRKGLEPLLHALSYLRKEHFQLSVVGEDKDLSYFTSLCRHLHLQGRVLFFGKQPSAIPFYQYADALIIPSFYDPFANVTIEALAMGLFVLSSNHNGGKEILNEKSGAVIPHLNDPKEFSRQLLTLFSKRKTAASASAIRDCVQHLDFSRQLDAITHTTLNCLTPSR